MSAILVTGSRGWTNIEAIGDSLRPAPLDAILIHGAARGADAIASSYWINSGRIAIPVPYFVWLGARGGPERNRVMLHMLLEMRAEGHTVHVYAFPMHDSRGTWDMVNKAKAAGLAPVVVRDPLEPPR